MGGREGLIVQLTGHETGGESGSKGQFEVLALKSGSLLVPLSENEGQVTGPVPGERTF